MYISEQNNKPIKHKTMENLSLKQGNVNCMTVICNIQGMNEVINKNYDRFKDFKRLEKISYNNLFEEQNNLIEAYNNSITSK